MKTTPSVIYSFLVDYAAVNGKSPTFTDIKRSMSLKSIDTVHYWLSELVREGLIEYKPKVNKSIRIIDKTIP